MVRLNDPRGRLPLTPSLEISREQLDIECATGAKGPTSPPETPTASPLMASKSSQAGPYYRFCQSLAQDPNIKPVGNGHQFSYQRRVVGPEKLSPRSSSSSTDADEESGDKSPFPGLVGPRIVADSSMAEWPGGQGADVEDMGSHVGAGMDDETVEHGNVDDEDDGDGDDFAAGQEAHTGPRLRLALSDPFSQSPSAAGTDVDDVLYRSRPHVASSDRSSLACDFVIEDMDPMDSGGEEGLEVLHPTEIESSCSRSRSRYREFDKGMVRDFKNLNCSNESSDNEHGEPEAPGGVDEEALFWQRQKEIRRHRRASVTGSFGKRTHSEISDSEGSEVGTLDVNDVGSSARRMHKRLHRGGLLFQDPPAPRIDELEEPDSGEEEYDAADPFARELPYWTMEIIQMDST